MSNKFFFLSFFILLFLAAPLQAEILTIDKEPAEFTKLRANYEQQMKNAATPAKLKQLQSQFQAAKKQALQSPNLSQKVSSLEKARDLEIQKINKLYNNRIEALKKEAITSVERKYQAAFDNFKNNTKKKVKNQYIMDLKRLEDKLIRQQNLAGALVVQTERNKIMGISAPAAAAAPAPAKVAAPKPAPKKAAPAPKKAAPKPAASSGTLSAAKPQVYSSTLKGIAGSGSNVVNNVYSFDIGLVGDETWLSFNGYGRETNQSFGEVYLITPSGQRHQVASWSPDQLQATSYYGVKGAKDVQAIQTNISEFVKSKGVYKVEFTYRDGNEPLYIYQVEIKTW